MRKQNNTENLVKKQSWLTKQGRPSRRERLRRMPWRLRGIGRRDSGAPVVGVHGLLGEHDHHRHQQQRYFRQPASMVPGRHFRHYNHQQFTIISVIIIKVLFTREEKFTFHQGNFPMVATATETAGFKWPASCRWCSSDQVELLEMDWKWSTSWQTDVFI